jgi:predicted RNase H-like nuclease (RuvC/YqgF family)
MTGEEEIEGPPEDLRKLAARLRTEVPDLNIREKSVPAGGLSEPILQAVVIGLPAAAVVVTATIASLKFWCEERRAQRAETASKLEEARRRERHEEGEVEFLKKKIADLEASLKRQDRHINGLIAVVAKWQGGAA